SKGGRKSGRGWGDGRGGGWQGRHHGSGHHDFDVWVQQWTDFGRGSCLLRHGARWAVFQTSRQRQRASRAGSRFVYTGIVGFVPRPATYRHGQSTDCCIFVWKRLHATAGIYRFGGFDFLRVDGWGGDGDAEESAGD